MGGSFWIFIEGGCRFRDFLAARAYPKLEADIRMTLFDHVQHHSPKYFNEHFSGSLSNKIGDMVLTTSSILRDISITFIPSFLTCVLTVVVFAQMNAFLALTVGVWLLVHFIFLLVFHTKMCQIRISPWGI